jgi:hypothetical protein
MKTTIIGLSPFAYESVTVSSSAVGLTAATYRQAGYAVQAFLTLEGAEIRWRIDGSNPTTTEGHLLEPGQNLTLDSPDAVKNFRAIRTGATNGTLKVTYFRG